MFVIVTDPTTGKRLTARTLSHEVGLLGQGFRISTRHGIPGLRSTGQPFANITRDLWASLQRFVNVTGYTVHIETTQREANALLGGQVMSNGGRYRLMLSEDRKRVVTKYGSN